MDFDYEPNRTEHIGILSEVSKVHQTFYGISCETVFDKFFFVLSVLIIRP